jgi:hypothetical protein
MVAFLLITSIWTQLARLEVAQKGQGDTGVEGPIERPLRVAVLVSVESFSVVVNDDQKPIPKCGAAYDYAKLVDELKVVKDTHPDNDALQILSEDGIAFEILIKTMDAAMSAGFPDLSLLDAAGGR